MARRYNFFEDEAACSDDDDEEEFEDEDENDEEEEDSTSKAKNRPLRQKEESCSKTLIDVVKKLPQLLQQSLQQLQVQ